MMTLGDFLNSKVGTAQFNWQELETELGFPLHEGLKNFYSKAYERIVRGEIKFNEADFLVPTGNEKFDKWFSFNKVKGEIEIKLNIIKSQEDAQARMNNAFYECKGGNDFKNASKVISMDEIKEIERKLEITLPKQLGKHYLKYNGGVPIRNYLFSRISDIETSVQTFLPMKYKNATGFSLEEMYLNFVEKKVFSKRYLPFAIDYGGNLFCVNLENERIVMIWLDKGDVEENKIPILSNSFNGFLNSLEEADE